MQRNSTICLFYFYIQYPCGFKHFPMTRTDTSFFQNKIAKAGKDSSTSGMDLGAVLYFSVRTPNTNHHLVHQRRREKVRRMLLFPCRGKDTRVL